MRMIIFTSVFIALMHLNVAFHDNISAMCGPSSCQQGDKVCRVVSNSSDNEHFTQQCFDHVPDDMDEVCSAAGYEKAIIIGTHSRYHCHREYVSNVENKVNCPTGSDCIGIPGSDKIGVCCYGKSPDIQPVWPAFNIERDETCIPPCNEGDSCQAELYQCGYLRYVCKRRIRSGICPGSEYIDDCSTSQTCNFDDDCPSGLRCCPMQCGVSNDKMCSPVFLT